MKRTILKVRNWLGKAFSNRLLKLFSDTVILVASSYLMIKKVSGFSISGWLLENALQQPLVNIYVVVSMVVLILAILAKIGILLFEYFPPLNHSFVEPDEISNCLHRINSEIAAHLSKCNGSAPVDIRTICDQHGFNVNLGLIVDALAEHIRKSIKNIRIKKKDLFISLYSYDEEKNQLEYMFHYDSKRDLVESRIIALDAPKFQGYESVKCLNSTNTTAYVLDRNQYAKGASKRHKTIQHYIGCKLSSEERIFGFLNIEFHNEAIFPDESVMQDFLEEHIYPFKLLLEYQFLKKYFFHSFKEFDTHWRAA